MMTKVVSGEAYLETLEEYECEEKQKRKRKSERIFSEHESDESMENDISLPLEESTEEVEEKDDRMNKCNLEELLLNLWKYLSPPREETDIKSKWYAFIFKHLKKIYLYVGRAIQPNNSVLTNQLLEAPY